MIDERYLPPNTEKLQTKTFGTLTLKFGNLKWNNTNNFKLENTKLKVKFFGGTSNFHFS